MPQWQHTSACPAVGWRQNSAEPQEVTQKSDVAAEGQGVGPSRLLRPRPKRGLPARFTSRRRRLPGGPRCSKECVHIYKPPSAVGGEGYGSRG